jgi:predicted permease
MSELRHALRVLLFKAPAFTAMAVVSLALGIGANAAIFSLLHAVVLRTLAAPDPQRLAGLSTVGHTGAPGKLSYPAFERIASHQRSFSGLFVWSDSAVRTIDADGVLFAGKVLLAGDGFAETMRMRPVMGRSISDQDGNVAVLGYQCWRRYFQGSGAVLGKTIRVEGKPCTVVGVAPANFTDMELSGTIDVIAPLRALAPLERLQSDQRPVWEVTGRLKPGVTLEQVRTEMEALWPWIRTDAESRIHIDSAARGSGFNFVRVRFAFPLKVLLGISGLLLLLASTNLAMLLSARTNARLRETGIRLALGAGGTRILRQFLAESLLLAGAGSLAGICCGRWASWFFARFVWNGLLDNRPELELDGAVLAFVVSIAVVSGLVVGLIPAARAIRMDPSAALRGICAGGAGGAGKLLIVFQVAASLVLVVAATLFAGTLRNLQSVPLGFNSANLLGIQLTNRPGGYRGMDPLSYYPALGARLAAVPGVRAVSALSASAPVLPPVMDDVKAQADGASAIAQALVVWPRFFETMQIPFVAGRDFTFHDTASAPAMAIVSETLARKLFGSKDAVGRHVAVSGWLAKDVAITGVVRDSGVGSFQKQNPMQLFVSSFQQDSILQPYLVVRTSGPLSEALARRLRSEIETFGREFPIRVESMDSVIARALVEERLMAYLAGTFGTLALLLAAIGLYGLMSYSVARRSRDIGIRMALGAQRRTVMWMVLRESFVLVATGFALSMPVIYVGSKIISKLLYGVRPLDPVMLGTAVLILLASAAAAVYLPARRAASLDPMAALNSE